MDVIGVPDWFAQRVWMATLLFLAGTGVRWAARQARLRRGRNGVRADRRRARLHAVALRAAVHLTDVGAARAVGRARMADRTHGARRAIRRMAPRRVVRADHRVDRREQRHRARHDRPGSDPVPARRRHPRSTAVASRARPRRRKIGCLTILVSVWWAAGVYVQGRYGADVLAFSETVQSTSYTSSSPEVLRGLGYWLFYVRDAATATTGASGDYQTSTALIGWGWLLIVAGFAGIALLRWRARQLRCPVRARRGRARGRRAPDRRRFTADAGVRRPPALVARAGPAQLVEGRAGQPVRARARRRRRRVLGRRPLASLGPDRTRRRRAARAPQRAGAALAGLRRHRAVAQRGRAVGLAGRSRDARRVDGRRPGAAAARRRERRLPVGLHGGPGAAGHLRARPDHPRLAAARQRCR